VLSPEMLSFVMLSDMFLEVARILSKTFDQGITKNDEANRASQTRNYIYLENVITERQSRQAHEEQEKRAKAMDNL